MPPVTPPPRLSLLVARAAPIALILRRGPTKWVELVGWDTRTDTFTRGAWFHGRIYQRRCDLSPDGQLLVYFVSKFSGRTLADREYTSAWTAVSRPPWLTALALWPKGDCWWGGGVFLDQRTLFLNHRPAEAVPHPKHLPRTLRIQSNPEAHGEDDPIYHRRLGLEGWERVQEWQWSHTYGPGFRTESPDLWRRRQPNGDLYLGMERTLTGYKYRERFRLERDADYFPIPGGPVDAANWLADGRLACLGDSKISTLTCSSGRLGPRELLLDLTADRPKPEPAPPWANSW